jgi:phage gp29-like protein
MAKRKKKNKVVKQPDQLTEQTVSYDSWEQFPTYPSDNLSPARLDAILKQAAAGDMHDFAQLAEDMEEKDLDLQGVLGDRKLAISGLEYEILPASEDPVDIHIADFCREVLEYIPSFSDVLYGMMDALGKGYSVHELIWEHSEGQWWIDRIEYIQPYKFTFTHENKIQRVPRLLTGIGSMESDPLKFGKFLCHQHKSKSGLPTRNGLHRTLSRFYLFKNFDVKSWVMFLERFGFPLRLGKYGSTATDEDKRVLRKAVFDLATDTAAIVSDSTNIEFIELKSVSGGAKVFEGFKDFINDSYSKLILGHSGSADSTPGKLGNDDLLASDALSIQQTVTQQILAAIVMFHYGSEASVPKFKLKYESGEDLMAITDMYGKLVSTVGLKTIPVQHIHERLNIPMAKAGELTIGDLMPSVQPNTQPQQFSSQAHLSQVQYSDSAVDKITDKMSAETSFELLLKKAEDLLNDCADLETFQDRLVELAKDLKPSEKAAVINQGLQMAHLAGRAGARQREDV